MNRATLLDRARAGGTWDFVVIGGGATGLGTAVDAASRGYRTLLLEAHDFAKGTSSRSTKLVHGGVRYLAQGRIGLVREALHERGLLRRNAPHLVHDRTFLVPAYSWWARPYYGLGLKVYDLLAGGLNLGSSRAVRRDEAIALAPTLRAEGLRGGIVYVDGQFDDARLAIALMRTILDHGGTALNYAPITDLIKEGGRVRGVRARDAETGEEFAVAAKVVVNATGVFADAVRRLDEPEAPALIAPSQGIHLVLDRTFLPGSSALMIPRTDDGRVLFAIPWHDRVLLGTTDTPVERPEIEPRPRPDELDDLLAQAARYLSRVPTLSDVRSVFAGLRPLIKPRHATATSQLSREHSIFVSPSGLVTITGGKWTTYRRMAADTVDRAVQVAGLAMHPCATARLTLHGGTPGLGEGPLSVYGSDSSELDRLCGERPEWGRPLHPELPYRLGEVIWAARHESARTVEDVLARRTRALFLDAGASYEAAPLVASLLSHELVRGDAWRGIQIREFRELCEGYLPNRK